MAFSKFEFMVAGRYLRARRKEGFVSVISGFSLLGIALGVATLIIVMSVMNGFREELLSRILGLNGHLGVYAQSAPLTDYEDMTQRLKRIDKVQSVIPIIEGQVMISANNSTQGAVLRGMRFSDIAERDVIASGISGAPLDKIDKKKSVIVGYRLADKMGIRIGDSVTLISPQGQVTAFGTVPRMQSYRVAATFNVGMHEYDANFVFMSLSESQRYFDMPDRVSNLEIVLENHTQIERVRMDAAAIVGAGRKIHDWKQANFAFFNAVEVERNVMFLILTLIILVAAFNIISGLIMLVYDKGRGIAILRTMGATRGSIMRIFFLCGASIGAFGTMLGFVLGLVFCHNIESIRQFLQNLSGTELFSAEIYFLSQLPAIIDPAEVASVVLMALALSFGATIYPSWRAARLDPVEALRNE